MILADLKLREARFEAYDCTEQCNGMCMNGFIGDLTIVYRYLNKINAIFSRTGYLEKQAEEFRKREQYFSFTEMRAYNVFKTEETFRKVRLNEIIDGESFDDCICQSHGMEMEKLWNGREIKRIYFSADGKCFSKALNNGGLVRMVTLNCSWVPIYIFRTVLEVVQGRSTGGRRGESARNTIVPLTSAVRKWAILAWVVGAVGRRLIGIGRLFRVE